MARSAKRPKSGARVAPKGAAVPKGAAIRPVLLAAGLGLYWFVENQDGGGVDVPVWGYATMQGVRVLVDFIGAWVVVSVLQLAIALGRLGLTHLRTLWAPQSR